MLKNFLFIIVFLSIFVKVRGNSSCEVCVKTIEKFAETLSDEEKKNPLKIEENLKKFCSKVRVDSKEDRLCYYIGASKTSATYAIGDFSKPLSWGIPIEKICRERLAKTNPQICELKFEKPIDVDGVDLQKLKVKDLKKILESWGEPADFMEKSDFIRRINEVKHQYISLKSKDL